MQIITRWDKRFNSCLDIEFNLPIGIGSYGFDTIDEFVKKFYVDFADKEQLKFEDYVKCNLLEDDINDLIVKTLEPAKLENKSISLDYRDDLCLWIHDINLDIVDDNLIEKLDTELIILISDYKVNIELIKVNKAKIMHGGAVLDVTYEETENPDKVLVKPVKGGSYYSDKKYLIKEGK